MSAPAHFMSLTGASTLNTRYFQLARHAVTHLVAHQATGVIYGPAGTGKTFAAHSALAEHVHTQPVVLVFPSHPTMRVVADELLFSLTGERAPARRNRFQLIASLVDHLAGLPASSWWTRPSASTATASNSYATCTITPTLASPCCTWAATAAGRCCPPSRCCAPDCFAWSPSNPSPARTWSP